MASDPLPDFGQFIEDVLTAPYRPDAMRRLLEHNFFHPGPALRGRFSSPCEDQGCESCTGVGCDCECHLAENQTETTRA